MSGEIRRILKRTRRRRPDNKKTFLFFAAAFEDGQVKSFFTLNFSTKFQNISPFRPGNITLFSPLPTLLSLKKIISFD